MTHFRPYQVELVTNLRRSFAGGNKRIVLCAPTGAGKTIMFTYMAVEHAKKGGKVLILTHRGELLKQAAKGLQSAQMITPKLKVVDHENPFSIGMVETIYRRTESLKDFLASRTLVICDEAHLENFTKLFEYISPTAAVIGATATPYRKHSQNCLSEFYTDLIQSVDTPDLIEQGFLSRAITYSVPINLKGLKKTGDDYDTAQYYVENKTYEGVVENYLRHSPNEKALLFSSNVASSKQVCKEFNLRHIKALHIDGGTPDYERAEILDWFANTPNAVLCNCGVLTAGFDQPDITTIILYRATTSLPLFLQMCGRGSRVTETKRTFKILDFGMNVERLGFWQMPRIWSLKKQAKREKAKGAPPMRTCEDCGALIPAKVKICPECGHEHIQEKKRNESVILEQLLELPKGKRNKFAKTASFEVKVEMCKAKLVHPLFVCRTFKFKEEMKEFQKAMGYKQGWLHYNKDVYEKLQ